MPARNRFPIIALLLSALSVSMVYGQTGLAAALERGSVEQRYNALLKILDTPPERRDAAVWAALTRELKRALVIYHRLHDETLPPPPPSTTMSSEYYADLVQAVSGSRDPAVIPFLVQASGTGTDPTDALARFGDLAIPALLATVRGTTNDLRQRAGAMFALATMCQPQIPNAVAPVSAGSRRQIVELASELWHSKFDRGSLIPTSVFAVATRDSNLATHLERLASQSEAWADLGVTDPAVIEQGQRYLRYELDRNPR